MTFKDSVMRFLIEVLNDCLVMLFIVIIKRIYEKIISWFNKKNLYNKIIKLKQPGKEVFS